MVVVDDASDYGAIDRLVFEGPLSLLRNDKSLGYGGALARGLRHAAEHSDDGDVIATMDGDDTHPPELLPVMHSRVQEGATIVIASRFIPGSRIRGYPPRKRFLSGMGNLLYRCLLPVPGVTDYTNGYRMYSARLLIDAGLGIEPR